MYRLLLYYLIVLLVVAAALGAFGVINIKTFDIVGSAIFLTAVCWLSNKLFAYVYQVPTNFESAYITALILALIITPSLKFDTLVFMIMAGLVAMASKYLLAINKKHIFNPAAIAVALTGLAANHAASWWVGSSALLPYVLVGGLIIAYKIRRLPMVAGFLIAASLSSVVMTALNHQSVPHGFQTMIFHSSLFFLAFIMLTEPITSPTTADQQLVYAGLVGLLFSPQIHAFGLYSTPELALGVGNIYSYIISPKLKLMLNLEQKVNTGPDTADFVFPLDKPIDFKPGQYVEVTLEHQDIDSRGNRRYFTLASSPTEQNVRLGVKFYPRGSSFKKALSQIPTGGQVVASQLSGDFVMPEDKNQKLVFIAGGIGITPYRSMIKYLIDKREKRDIVMLYSEKKIDNFVYRDIFTAAQNLGVKSIYTVTDEIATPSGWSGQSGFISAEMVRTKVPDFMERHFYISGPHSLVVAIKAELRSLGVPLLQIKTDFFPGYA